MSSDDRRRSARVLSAFPLVLLDEKGAALDDHALAHDVSEKGFKAETQAAVTQGQTVRFRLALDAAGDVTGRARIVWVQKTDLSSWAGAQFLGISWSDRRRVRRMTRPSDVDWGAIADKAIVALALMLGTLVAWDVLTSTLWSGLMEDLFPKAVACLAAGWALRVLLTRKR